MDWNKLISNERFGMEDQRETKRDDRTEFQRDYDRLVFSAPFRRLQNKTQVFPLPGSIFVHNRLTHSLEVSCVGRSLGSEVAAAVMKRDSSLKNTYFTEIPSIVSAACLAHDLGNPPFGHSGEKAIATYFSEGKGMELKGKLTECQWDDLVNFEGNANTFRLLTNQFLGRRPGGFVMTYSTLASIVKYPFSSTFAMGRAQKFGFFETEKESFRRVADHLGMLKKEDSERGLKYARHPLVYLVEAADDICYQMMDIEDAHKLKILTYDETCSLYRGFFDKGGKDRIDKVNSVVTDTNERVAYLRARAIGILVRECVSAFMTHEEEILRGEFRSTLVDSMSGKCRDAFRRCSEVAQTKIYRSRHVLDVELAGYKVIYTLLDLMTEAVMEPEKTFSSLLIDRVSSQYDVRAESVYERLMAVCDYISGMTDVFALELYRNINGHTLPAV